MARSLLQKLGIKEGFLYQIINEPENYAKLLEDALPPETKQATDGLDFIHLFTNSIQELENSLPILQEKIVKNGMIWVSWYKRSSKLPSEINEDIIRNTALALKLVDVKVCSVSHEWSALKLVIRKSLR